MYWYINILWTTKHIRYLRIKNQRCLGGLAVGRLPSAQVVIPGSRIKLCIGLPVRSLLLPPPMSLPLSASISHEWINKSLKKRIKNQIQYSQSLFLCVFSFYQLFHPKITYVYTYVYFAQDFIRMLFDWPSSGGNDLGRKLLLSFPKCASQDVGSC